MTLRNVICLEAPSQFSPEHQELFKLLVAEAQDVTGFGVTCKPAHYDDSGRYNPERNRPSSEVATITTKHPYGCYNSLFIYFLDPDLRRNGSFNCTLLTIETDDNNTLLDTVCHKYASVYIDPNQMSGDPTEDPLKVTCYLSRHIERDPLIHELVKIMLASAHK